MDVKTITEESVPASTPNVDEGVKGKELSNIGDKYSDYIARH